MARPKKNRAVKVTAPDFGAVFAKIAWIVKRTTKDVARDEARAFWEYLTNFIRTNRAQPEGGTREQGLQRALRRRTYIRTTYGYRKYMEGYGTDIYGSIHAIRTGQYVNSIRVREESSGESASGTVDIPDNVFNARGLSLRSLAKILEYGHIHAVTRRVSTPTGDKRVFTHFTQVPARPHWRPAHVWYQTTRLSQVAKVFQARVQQRIRKNLHWRQK